MKHLLAFLYLCFMSFVYSCSWAQSNGKFILKKCPVKTINFETGLMNNGTTCIITDQLGFTWVSTLTGLQRYNGYSLQTIIPVVGKDTFEINGPAYLFGLNNGDIWISFRQIVLRYNISTNSFSEVIKLPSTSKLPYKIVPLKETDSVIWCMQEDQGVVIYSNQGKLLKKFADSKITQINNILNSVGFKYRNKVILNKDNIFIIQTEDNYTTPISSPKAGNIISINTVTQEIKNVYISNKSILDICSNNNKLFALCGKELLVFNTKGFGVIKKVNLSAFFTKDFLLAALSNKNDSILFLSINNRLFEFDTSGNYIDELTDLNRTPFVPNGFIFQIYPDRFRRIWLLTNNDIKRIEDVKIPFEHFFYNVGKGNFVRSIYCDEKINLVIAGCFYSGIQLYDTSGNPLWKNPLVIVGCENIVNIGKIKTDKYLLITFRKGWYVLSLKEKILQPLEMPEKIRKLLQPKIINFSNNLQWLNKDSFLIATANNIYKCAFTGTKLDYAESIFPEKILTRGTVNCFLMDSKRNLWVGCLDGSLYRLDQNNEIKLLDLQGNYLTRTIVEDNRHNIWIGTDKGLYVYTTSKKFLKKITQQSGLRNDCIYSILPVDSGSAVYVGSNLGLSFISLNGTIKNFSKEMGLQGNEFNTNSVYKSLNGKLYFGGTNGISAFYPSTLNPLIDSPKLYITNLTVNDITYNSSTGIWGKDSLYLNYGQNRLHFDLAAIGLPNSNEYVYQFRMSGFENNWNTTYLPTGINYTLASGTYYLEVNFHNILSSDTSFYKKFLIEIKAPWWESWWIRLSEIGLLIGIIFMFVYYYNRRNYLKKLRALQIRQKVHSEKERISRDLHDNLGAQANALLYGTEQLSKNNGIEETLVSNLQYTAKDMLQNLRETIWVMKHNDVSPEEIWIRIINFTKHLGSLLKNVDIITNGEPPGKINFSSEKALNIVLLLQEAINNAVRHSGSNRITIESKSEPGHWYLTVKDEGIGFNKDLIKDRAESFGLSNMQDRAQLANSYLMIFTKPGKGTSIHLDIPLN